MEKYNRWIGSAGSDVPLAAYVIFTLAEVSCTELSVQNNNYW